MPVSGLSASNNACSSPEPKLPKLRGACAGVGLQAATAGTQRAEDVSAVPAGSEEWPPESFGDGAEELLAQVDMRGSGCKTEGPVGEAAWRAAEPVQGADAPQGLPHEEGSSLYCGGSLTGLRRLRACFQVHRPYSSTARLGLARLWNSIWFLWLLLLHVAKRHDSARD